MIEPTHKNLKNSKQTNQLNLPSAVRGSSVVFKDSHNHSSSHNDEIGCIDLNLPHSSIVIKSSPDEISSNHKRQLIQHDSDVNNIKNSTNSQLNHHLRGKSHSEELDEYLTAGHVNTDISDLTITDTSINPMNCLSNPITNPTLHMSLNFDENKNYDVVDTKASNSPVSENREFQLLNMIKKLKKYKYSYELERNKCAGLIDAIAEKNVIIDYMQDALKRGNLDSEHWIESQITKSADDPSFIHNNHRSLSNIITTSERRRHEVHAPSQSIQQSTENKLTVAWEPPRLHRPSRQQQHGLNSSPNESKSIDLNNSYEYSKAMLIHQPTANLKLEPTPLQIDTALVSDLKSSVGKVKNLVQATNTIESKAREYSSLGHQLNIPLRPSNQLHSINKVKSSSSSTSNSSDESEAPASPDFEVKVFDPKKSNTPEVINQRITSPPPTSRLPSQLPLQTSKIHPSYLRTENSRYIDASSSGNSNEKVDNLQDQVAALQGILEVQEEIERILEKEVRDMRDMIGAQKLLLQDWLSKYVQPHEDEPVNLEREIAKYLKRYRRERSQRHPLLRKSSGGKSPVKTSSKLSIIPVTHQPNDMRVDTLGACTTSESACTLSPDSNIGDTVHIHQQFLNAHLPQSPDDRDNPQIRSGMEKIHKLHSRHKSRSHDASFPTTQLKASAASNSHNSFKKTSSKRLLNHKESVGLKAEVDRILSEIVSKQKRKLSNIK